MKKILALALIALIAVTAVFAAENEQPAATTVVGPRDAKIKYEVTGLFEPKFELDNDINDSYVIDFGQIQDKMPGNTVVFTVKDMTNFNDSGNRTMKIVFTVGNFILQAQGASENNPEQMNKITSTLALTTDASETGATVELSDKTLDFTYVGGNIVNRTGEGEGNNPKDVATLTLTWSEKRVQAGHYLATIVIAPSAL